MKKENREIANAFILILQISITMVVPIFLCLLCGLWLDQKLGTSWLAVIGFFMGAIAGGQNVYRLVKRYIK